MARRKDALSKMLKLLNKKSMLGSEICTTLKIDRKTSYRIIKESLQNHWIQKDPSGRYHLTLLGIASLNLAEYPTSSETLEVQTQIIDFLSLRRDRPTAKCTIQIENADRIKELDSQTDATKRFLTRDGL